ncbi:AGAP001710-PA-like protein [Anopheles sinensis]|uniref:AGAP001710-PA-like protein n=1 Tax=Anopheles sinensis TaxID=74873 RepID=A0A084VI16_ANOSI|nr:AGAP001710-PA-like protein [Anopheles sinensis]
MSLDPTSAVSNLESLQVKDDLFKNVKCFVTGTLDPKITKLLKDGGVSMSKFMDFCSHLICGANYDENDITEAGELYEIPSVTEAWVVASVRLGRLASTKAYFPLKTGIFCGLRFSATQIDTRDLRRLYAVLTFHGGTFSSRLDRKTTHLVCGSARGPAYSKALTCGTGVHIVTPDWVADCLKSSSIKPVAVYHPRLLREQRR